MVVFLWILYLEDSEFDYEFVSMVFEGDLGCDFIIQWVEDEEGFLIVLCELLLYIVLSDFVLLGYDGLSVFYVVYQFEFNLFFIIVIGVMGEEVVVDMLCQGVIDYIFKVCFEWLVFVVNCVLVEVDVWFLCEWVEQEVCVLNVSL